MPDMLSYFNPRPSTEPTKTWLRGGLAGAIESRAEGFSPDWTRLARAAFIVLLATLAAGLVIYWFCALKVLPFPYDFKGWSDSQMMHNALLLSQGKNFYVDPNLQPSSAYCYAPLMQIILAPLVLIFGPKLWVGRMVAMAVLVAIWAVMYVTVRGRTDRGVYGFLAVGVLMSSYGLMSGHFDDIHPDGLVTLFGLLTLMGAEKSLARRSWLAVAVGCGVLSFFSKQTGASFIAGAALFLLLHRPLYALIYSAAVGALIGLGMAVGQALTGGQFWYYLIVTYLLLLKMYFPAMLFLLTVGLARPRALLPTSPYTLAFPLVFALTFTGGVRYGGSIASVFPGLMLGAMVMSFALAWVREEWSRSTPVLAFVLFLLLSVQTIWLISNFPAYPRKAHYEAAAHLESLVRNTPGEVMVFYPISLAFLNGRPVYDNGAELYDQITWKDHRRLEGQLRSSYFSLLLIPQKFEDLWFKAQPAYKFIQDNYEIQEIIYQPAWFQVTPMKVYRRKATPHP